MPEIAEVRLIADTMARFLVGKRLLQLRVRDPVKSAKWVSRCCSRLADFNARLSELEQGLLVKGVHTRGKFSWLECEGNIFIGIHFGMSGNIRPEPTPEFLATYRWRGKPITREEFLKHCLIALEYKDSEDQGPKQSFKQIYYHDIRRFGRFDIYWNRAELDAKLAKLGHDPLSQEELPDAVVIQRFRLHNHKNICKLLMGQELLAGVGNYMKSETLYSAGISPHATVRDLPDSALLTLYRAVRKISREAYEAGGATLYTYTGIQGDQTEFKGTLTVYGRGGEKDPNGHTIQRIADNQSPDRRTTFWVPEVQVLGHNTSSIRTTVPVPVPVPIPVPVPTPISAPVPVPVEIKLLKPIHAPPKLRKK